MDRIIGVTELQRRFRAVFDEVAQKRVAYILTRGSRPEVVMIPYEDYLRFTELSEQGVLARFDQAAHRLAEANASYGEDELADDLREARRAARKRR